MRPGVANIGRNPTFGEFEMTVEAHILDFKGKLYDQPIRVHFVQRIRSEKKFSGPEELITRIREDIGLARMRENAAAPASTVINALVADLKAFKDGLPLEDDVTLVVIKATA